MFVFYEDEGTFKTGNVLVDNTTSLQVESVHGKRSKIKAAAVMFQFKEPGLGAFMDAAHQEAEKIDLDFLWECSGQAEFVYSDLGKDYFGHEPSPVESAGLLLRLHSAPMYFYKKGKGKYKPAPPESLKAALASEERKRKQAEQIAQYVAELSAFKLPDAFPSVVSKLLYGPDKNSIEYKALEQACGATGLTAVKLLEKCGAIPSTRDFHLNRFLFEHFPKGSGFPEVEVPLPSDLPHGTVKAFSIDDETTTEIDDAFSLEWLENGHVQVGVHIAAPALAIAPDSPLDEIALARLSTVYLPGDKITMLPDSVIAAYALSEGRSCPSVSFYAEIDGESNIVATRNAVEQVDIVANLRHEMLEPLFNEDTVQIDGPDYPYRRELTTLWHFANKLEALRGKADEAKGLVPEYVFRIRGDHVEIGHRHRGTPIDKVVAELMILVNSRWAGELSANTIPGLYRVQEGGKVRMSTVPGKHQGLGVDQYAWSSSPLRRYVDLINQRQIVAMVRGEPPVYQARSEALYSAMRAFEMAYDAYNSFQRNMERYWCLRYMIQENLAEMTASVIREDLVRFDRLPIVTRVASLPLTEAGSTVRLKISDIDLLELTFHCEPAA